MFQSLLISSEFSRKDNRVDFFAEGLEVGIEDGESGVLQKKPLVKLLVLSNAEETDGSLIVIMTVTVVFV